MGEQKHALVVDDEDALRFFIQETLKRAGITATGAASGEEVGYGEGDEDGFCGLW